MKVFTNAVLIALLLWLILGLTFFQPRALNLPLQVRGLASDLAVENSLPQIKVFVSGAGSVGGIEAFVDLSQIKMPVVVREKIQILSDKKVLAFSPSSIEISVVTSSNSSFVVEPKISQFPPAGFAVQSINFSPSHVAVAGSEKVLNSIAYVGVVMDLSALTSSRSFSLAPIAFDAGGNQLNSLVFSPPLVTANIVIAAGDDIKAVAVEPVLNNNLPAGFTLKAIEVDPKVVTLRGATSILATLGSVKTTPIDLAGRFQDFTQEVSLDLPPQVALLHQGSLVNVKVLLNSSVTTTTLKLVPQYVNIAESLQLTKSSPSLIEVVISGPADIIGHLTNKQVSLSIDLTGILSGASTVRLTPAMVQTPAQTQALVLNPQEVSVVLTRK